jgi:hypothetical protein
MGRLQTHREWLKFTRNGAIVGLVAALLFFWNSPHTAEEISVTIALPLIIFNCTPFVLTGIASVVSMWFPKVSPQKRLSFPDKPPVNIKDLPLKQRLAGYAILGTLIVMLMCFFAGIAIFLATFAYPHFYVPWAVTPARHLAYLLVGVSVFPIVAVMSFLAGLRYSGKFRDSAIFYWISARTTHPLSYWPTAA